MKQEEGYVKIHQQRVEKNKEDTDLLVENMKEYKLLLPTKVGSIEIKNRIVMAPMTRCRAIGNLANDLMATYYGQRSGAGLIITEGTSPSINGLGYARIPRIFTEQQVKAWEIVTKTVHTKAEKIIVQLMHTGRIGHPLNLHKGGVIQAPSAIKAAGQIWTDSKQLQDYQVPVAMTLEDIAIAKSEYVMAAQNAIEAGFDGVELHAANGYLLEQFLSPISNIRSDDFGGSVHNRCAFILDVVASVAEAIGKEKTGIRLSPYGVANDMPHYPAIDETYEHLTEQLNKIGIAYIHLVDHSAMGAPPVPLEIKLLIRKAFKGTIILCGGYDRGRAEGDLKNGLADLIAFGRPFINNPDLVDRFKNNWALSTDLHSELFYTSEAQGYTDYQKHNDLE